MNSSLTVKEVSYRILLDACPDHREFVNDAGDVLLMEYPHGAVDGEIGVIACWRVSDELVGAAEVLEAVPVGCHRWHVGGLVDDEAGERASLLEEISEAVRKCLIV